MREAPPPDLGRVYILTDGGLRQLTGGGTALSDSALRLLVLIDGKLPLSRLAKHLEGVAEVELTQIASALIFGGYIKPLSADAVKLTDDLGAIDFFDDSSAEAATPAEKKEQQFAHALEEAQNMAMTLKQQGYCVRIARRPARKPKHAEGEKYSVLVVEDNANLATVTKKFLALEGFAPRMAAKRDEVLAELRKPPMPDLMLLDVVLPDADGFEILASLRRHPALQRLPVILLTAKATKEDVMHGLMLGADGYITKPFEFDILIAGMRAVLGLDQPDNKRKA
jgi:two-component system, OmpR family, response regulator